MFQAIVVAVFTYLALLAPDGNAFDTFPLLTPLESNISFILKAFVELQSQWCPPWRYKKFYILNYNSDQLSEDILTGILQLNGPPWIISTEASGLTYWTYENNRCAVIMVSGYERMRPARPLYYGSRYFIFHPNLVEGNVFMDQINSGMSCILDKAYFIVYNRTTIEIQHKNFFTNRTIQLDPANIQITDDLKDLHGRKLHIALPEGNEEVATFERYLAETICQQRNASYEISSLYDASVDYGVVNMGVPFPTTDKTIALGSTFVSVMVPRSKPKPIIAALIDPFDYYTWITLFVLIFLLALVLSLFGKVLSQWNIIENALEMIMCILGGPTRKYGGWFENQIITNYCLLAIVIVYSYQSLIISYLTYTRYSPEINTEDEIRNHCIFPVGSTWAAPLDFHTDGEYDDGRDNMCFLFASRDDKQITTLLVENMRDIDPAAGQAYKRNLRVADTVLLKYYLLYYFFNKSIIRELFPFYIGAFRESGLFDQHYRNKSIRTAIHSREMFGVRSFSVADLSIIWYMYAGGVMVSILWFGVEIAFFHCLRCGRMVRKRCQTYFLRRKCEILSTCTMENQVHTLNERSKQQSLPVFKQQHWKCSVL
uniref:Ionotropic glutamate receptor C-terminal domain-containing protein n=1 Tax=Anopheles coluzzii TaxID=1518534 RepID=A0A8W7Q2Q3_ANOCL